MFIDYNQNAKDRTVASAYSVRPTPDARVSMPLRWEDLPACEMEDFTLVTVPGHVCRNAATRPRASTRRSGRWRRSWSCRRATRRRDRVMRPWPPHYAKPEGEPPRVAPSKQRRPSSEYGPSLPLRPPERLPGGGSRPTPTGRRKTSIPVVEIARAEYKEQALEGLERWKARHPGGRAAPGAARTSWWTPCAAAPRRGTGSGSTSSMCRPRTDPARKPLELDYDPWAGHGMARPVRTARAGSAEAEARRRPGLMCAGPRWTRRPPVGLLLGGDLPSGGSACRPAADPGR